MSRLNASDMRCNRMDESPSDSGFARGSGGVCGAARDLAAVCAVMVSPFALLFAGGYRQDMAKFGAEHWG
jgi:hypothetical protein